MNEIEKFKSEVEENITGLSKDLDLQAFSRVWIREISRHKYSYNFNWLGRPAIQFPQDQIALQEIIWNIKPDLIIETGIAHGGSLIFSASMLALLDICEAIDLGGGFNPSQSKRRVLGLDIDIRSHNKLEIEAHPLSSRIQMIEGSSISEDVISKVKEISSEYSKILICLDSNHTHEHVLAELEAYAPLVTQGSYCIVLDTIIEDMPENMFQDRPWGKGNNSKTAVWQFLKDHPEFEIDKRIENKILITVAPDGYLRRL